MANGPYFCLQTVAVARSMKLAFATDFANSVVASTFRRRGWIEVPSEEEDWNIMWIRSTKFLMDFYRTRTAHRLSEFQIINHFPTFYELSRKDMLVRNIIRYRKKLESEGDPIAVKNDKGTYVFLDFLPTTYVLPGDYNMFLEEYKKNPRGTWIIKPCGKSRGTGIFLMNKISKLRKWSKEIQTDNVLPSEGYVISKYIANPLLMGGKKFDLRLYVLVTSFHPLKAYLFKLGFCRFCTLKYDKSVHELENMFVHLTNVSIQKNGPEYNKMHGGKLTTQNLMLYLESTRGKEVTERLFKSISWLIVHSLKAVVPKMAADRHSFEIYGYDIIIDNNLKPWLIEVNTSPSLECTTVNDRVLKYKLISNVLSIVLPPTGIPDIKWNKIPSTDDLGDFERLVDEDLLGAEGDSYFAGKCRPSSCSSFRQNK